MMAGCGGGSGGGRRRVLLALGLLFVALVAGLAVVSPPGALAASSTIEVPEFALVNLTFTAFTTVGMDFDSVGLDDYANEFSYTFNGASEKVRIARNDVIHINQSTSLAAPGLHLEAEDVWTNSVVGWRAYVERNDSEQGHFRFGIDTSKVSTLADIYFESDSTIRVDNGFGTVAVAAFTYQPYVWYRFLAWVDWKSNPPIVVLMSDRGVDGAPLEQVAAIEAGCTFHCKYFKDVFLFNDVADDSAFYDDIYLRDVAQYNISVTATTTGAFVVVNEGSDAPADSSCEDAIESANTFVEVVAVNTSASNSTENTTTVTTYGAGVNGSVVVTGSGGAFGPLPSVVYRSVNETTRFTAIACVNTTAGEELTSETYAVRSEPPTFETVSTGVSGAEAASNVTAGTSEIRVALLHDGHNASILWAASEEEADALNCTESANYTYNPATNVEVTETSTLFAVACEPRRLISRVRVSDQYEVQAERPFIETLNRERGGLYLGSARLRLTTQTSGARIVYTLGDGSQTNPTCNMDVTSDDYPPRGEIAADATGSDRELVLEDEDGVKAISCKSGNVASETSNEFYNIMTWQYTITIIVGCAIVLLLTVLFVCRMIHRSTKMVKEGIVNTGCVQRIIHAGEDEDEEDDDRPEDYDENGMLLESVVEAKRKAAYQHAWEDSSVSSEGESDVDLHEFDLMTADASQGPSCGQKIIMALQCVPCRKAGGGDAAATAAAATDAAATDAAGEEHDGGVAALDAADDPEAAATAVAAGSGAGASDQEPITGGLFHVREPDVSVVQGRERSNSSAHVALIGTHTPSEHIISSRKKLKHSPSSDTPSSSGAGERDSGGVEMSSLAASEAAPRSRSPPRADNRLQSLERFGARSRAGAGAAAGGADTAAPGITPTRQGSNRDWFSSAAQSGSKKNTATTRQQPATAELEMSEHKPAQQPAASVDQTPDARARYAEFKAARSASAVAAAAAAAADAATGEPGTATESEEQERQAATSPHPVPIDPSVDDEERARQEADLQVAADAIAAATAATATHPTPTVIQLSLETTSDISEEDSITAQDAAPAAADGQAVDALLQTQVSVDDSQADADPTPVPGADEPPPAPAPARATEAAGPEAEEPPPPPSPSPSADEPQAMGRPPLPPNVTAIPSGDPGESTQPPGVSAWRVDLTQDRPSDFSESDFPLRPSAADFSEADDDSDREADAELLGAIPESVPSEGIAFHTDSEAVAAHPPADIASAEDVPPPAASELPALTEADAAIPPSPPPPSSSSSPPPPSSPPLPPPELPEDVAPASDEPPPPPLPTDSQGAPACVPETSALASQVEGAGARTSSADTMETAADEAQSPSRADEASDAKQRSRMQRMASLRRRMRRRSASQRPATGTVSQPGFNLSATDFRRSESELPAGAVSAPHSPARSTFTEGSFASAPASEADLPRDAAPQETGPTAATAAAAATTARTEGEDDDWEQDSQGSGFSEDDEGAWNASDAAHEPTAEEVAAELQSETAFPPLGSTADRTTSSEEPRASSAPRRPSAWGSGSLIEKLQQADQAKDEAEKQSQGTFVPHESAPEPEPEPEPAPVPEPEHEPRPQAEATEGSSSDDQQAADDVPAPTEPEMGSGSSAVSEGGTEDTADVDKSGAAAPAVEAANEEKE